MKKSIWLASSALLAGLSQASLALAQEADAAPPDIEDVVVTAERFGFGHT